MKAAYAQAFLKVLDDGLPVEAALAGLQTALRNKRQEKLFLQVLHEAVRILESEKDTSHATVLVASEQDKTAFALGIKEALAELGAEKHTPITTKVDETLIGGFVVRYHNQEQDRSYKHALKSLYESIIR